MIEGCNFPFANARPISLRVVPLPSSSFPEGAEAFFLYYAIPSSRLKNYTERFFQGELLRSGPVQYRDTFLAHTAGSVTFVNGNEDLGEPN